MGMAFNYVCDSICTSVTLSLATLVIHWYYTFLVRHAEPLCLVCRLLTAAPQSLSDGRRAEEGGSEAAAQTAGTMTVYPARETIASAHVQAEEQKIWMLTFGKHKILPRDGRRWSAV